MYCKQEYFSSDNIITMVTILVCALTVTKYGLPYPIVLKMLPPIPSCRKQCWYQKKALSEVYYIAMWIFGVSSF